MNTSKTELLLKKVHDAFLPDCDDLEYLLSLEDEKDIREIFRFADETRRRFTGKGIYLRGLVEFSNFCRNKCFYCGLNAHNKALKRYRLTENEILESVALIASFGLQTVVLQSGEDDGLSPLWLSHLIQEIKKRFAIAVTLSVGEWPTEAYAMWREAGADRYLLKIETSDKNLYESLHPGMSFEKRTECLHQLKQLGYQTGSGIIVGLKNQTVKSIARDILFFKKEDFDMIGIGPFLPHPQTELRAQNPGSVFLTLKTLALTRVVTKSAHLPATTALGSANGDFRRDALLAGANVLMPNFTPQPYRELYEIYPAKRCIRESLGSCVSCMARMAESVDRTIDYARGDSLRRIQ